MFEYIWILHSNVSEFKNVKSKYSQTLEGKIQILKRQGEKFKLLQILGGKIQILKFQIIKSKYP